MLDQKYFELLVQNRIDNFNYQVYRPLKSPVILYSSKTYRPLASIHFLSKNGGSLITKVPESLNYQNFCNFQGITIQKDEEFSLVITNLSNKGMINFNIIKTNRKLDLLSQVNEINILDSETSYVLECDKSTGKAMILSIAQEEGKNEGIKMKDVVDKNDVGTFFSISITPEVTISDDYEDVKWGCLDFFVIKREHILFRGISVNRSRQMPIGILEKQERTNLDNNTLINSFATKINSGREIAVNSHIIDVHLDEEKRTKPMILGLSINEKVIFHSGIKEEILTAAKDFLDCYLENRLEKYLKEMDKIYENDICSICLFENPNLVIYNCGHKCLHQECANEGLNKCPICRKIIIAKIKV